MDTTTKKRDAILAGLCLLQQHFQDGALQTAPDKIGAIYTASQTHDGLSQAELDLLYQELNRGDAFVVLQEGGSSMEGPYVSSWSSEEEAEDHRIDCAKGAYRTSNVIRVPSLLAGLAEELYEVLDEVAQADFEYVDTTDADADADADADEE